MSQYVPMDSAAPVYGGQQVRIEGIIEALVKTHPDADVTLVQRAYIYAASAHQGMVRRSGEPYLNHPLAVAGILCDMKLDAVTVAAGLLHDTIEDTEATLEGLTDAFGREVANIVDGVTKISQINFASATERQAVNMRKMILAMLTDLRVILVKLADRLNNMRTLGFMPEHKQRQVASETLEIFAPLASRLGIHKIQAELEDLCLFYLEPSDYNEIRLELAAGRNDRLEYVNEVINLLAARIKEWGLKGQVDGRPKHIFSVWRKMRDQNLPFGQIYDLTAFRIVVPTVQDCYSALGMIHSIFTPIPSRFKDYINLPKPNGYQSLHTAVIGPRSMRMEVQIRTQEMHNYAENGVAAHWRYKEGGLVGQEENRRIQALRSVLSWQENLDNPNAFLSSVKEGLADYDEVIYVFTPMGDVKELPSGSCPVDFSYAIHTQVGHTCVGARVNGAIAPLRYKLQSGDMIEILTNRNGVPSRDWLNYVVTPKAKARIRQWFATEEREKAVAFGRDLLEKEMRKAGIPRNKLNDPAVLQDLGYNHIDELNASVAFGKLPVQKLLMRLAPEKVKPVSPSKPAPANELRAITGGPDSGPDDYSKHILVSGYDDIFVRRAKCCAPIPGEPVLGYITQGHGVSVHAADCPSLAGLDPERLIPVAWDEREESRHEVSLKVHCEDRPGVLMQVVSALTANVENILEVTTFEEFRRVLLFKVLMKNQVQFKSLVTALKKLSFVHQVERFYPGKASEQGGKEGSE